MDPTNHSVAPSAPPGTWEPARRLVRRALAPVERFLAVEASSGIVLLGAAVVALVWANTSARPFYEALWHTPFGLRLGDWSFERDLHFWINDGLMTLFFFVVGLEIRREIHRGELSELRRAALPLAAAAGGMAVPAALYLLVNGGRPSAVGWGVPMATDIAFAVGVLALLGKRVPPALRILLLALAVIDDVGAILVIAIFYTSGLAPLGLGVMAAAVALVITLQRFGVRAPLAYAPAALFVWAGAYAAGIHPTLAGVVMGLLTPARAWFGGAGFVASAEANLRSLREKGSDDEHEMLADLDEIDGARREAVSPVARLIHALHGWVAFGVMPLFALANAGVPLGDAKLTGDGLRVFVGVTLGLVIGKPAGVLGLSWLAARVGLVKLPTGIGWRQVVVVGLAAGIGFTMALFIAQLAFPPGPLLETSKLAILVGSVLGGLAAYAAGRRILTTSPIAGAASSESDAESATHA